MLHNHTNINIPHAFSKIRNDNIIVSGNDANKDYIKFGECFQVWTL
jgi:hypothetical protein